MDQLNSTPNIVYFSIVVILEAQYIFVIVALIINRSVAPFNSSFFTLWINLGISNCILTITLRVFAVYPMSVDWFQWPSLKGKQLTFWVCVFCKNEFPFLVFRKSRRSKGALRPVSVFVRCQLGANECAICVYDRHRCKPTYKYHSSAAAQKCLCY
jgi:hypothetical protein